MLHYAINISWLVAVQRVVLGYLVFIAPHLCEAQGNLIPNPSFEEADTCAVQLGFLTNGKPSHWACCETPDYLRSCVPYGAVNGVPVNIFGYQLPHDGESYPGMFAHLVDNYREMIAAELLEPLVVGQTYYGSFWINAAYGGSQYIGSACNNMGMLMWTTLNLATWQPNSPRPVLRNYAQVYSQQVIADTAGWSLVSGSFVADSAYRYVVVGNHFDNANTTVQVIGPGNPNEAYVFVDALCLSTDPDGCPMATSIRESNAGVIGLWPNPVSEWLRIRWGRLSVHSVIVVDAVGRRVVEQLVLGGQELTLAVHELRNGSYNLLLEGEGGKETRKFVVMR